MVTVKNSQIKIISRNNQEKIFTNPEEMLIKSRQCLQKTAIAMALNDFKQGSVVGCDSLKDCVKYLFTPDGFLAKDCEYQFDSKNLITLQDGEFLIGTPAEYYTCNFDIPTWEKILIAYNFASQVIGEDLGIKELADKFEKYCDYAIANDFTNLNYSDTWEQQIQELKTWIIENNPKFNNSRITGIIA